MALKAKIALCMLMGLGVMLVKTRTSSQGTPMIDTLYSTGACCIVRTVLNWQSIPKDDYTCKSRNQFDQLYGSFSTSL